MGTCLDFVLFFILLSFSLSLSLSLSLISSTFSFGQYMNVVKTTIQITHAQTLICLSVVQCFRHFMKSGEERLQSVDVVVVRPFILYALCKRKSFVFTHLCQQNLFVNSNAHSTYVQSQFLILQQLISIFIKRQRSPFDVIQS